MPTNARIPLITPSILTADFAHLAAQVQAAEADGADLFHLDVMDGRFVPNLSFGPAVIEAVRRTTTHTLDVHLMIVEPDRWIAEFARAGADRLTVHWEACTHLHRALSAIRDAGMKAGVALNPHTPVEVVAETAGLLDVVVLMAVNPGFGGQAFIPEAVGRAARLSAVRAAHDARFEILVDGGIKAETGARVFAAGADSLVVGSALFRDGRYIPGSIPALRTAIAEGADAEPA